MGTFQKAFVLSHCLAAWRKVSAATEDGITRTCLNDPHVMKEIGDGKEMDVSYASIQTANNLAIFALSMAGYNAHFLQATLEKKEVKESVCVPNTAARQEWLATARGHGGQFHASNGMHITDKDIFIAFEMKDCKKARAESEKDKKHWLQMGTNKEKALKILGNKGAGPESYSVMDLDCLLAWHQVKDLPPKAKREDKLARWREIMASQKPPPLFERWTNEDKQQLVALQSDVIGIKDTMFGREVALKKRDWRQRQVILLGRRERPCNKSWMQSMQTNPPQSKRQCDHWQIPCPSSRVSGRASCLIIRGGFMYLYTGFSQNVLAVQK
jgi:hypothetical protein